MSRRGFAIGVGAIAAGVGGWRWLTTRSLDDGTPWPFRRALEFNQRVAQTVFGERGLAPEFPRDRAREPRPNGPLGINMAIDTEAWRLKVEGPKGRRTLSLAEVKALPKVEMTTELRCIEGWSEIVNWGGARLADLAESTGLASRANGGERVDYVAMETPDRGYFVGLDAASALHPQTLLAYEMNGEPLTIEHGAPVRLAIPLKYGIKNIKQIGTIRFTDAKPADYWAELGYDWYAGH
jgi:DMSO/TMAO reductase YedYZ molybdopterin-dependent catalytic subunit